MIKTRGIVFKYTKYRETSIITNIFTQEVGLTSFIVNSVRSVKSKFKIGYFEPLSLVEITAYYSPNREINRLSEIKSAVPMHTIRQDMAKSAIIMFLAEILNKCIIERDKNPQLFAFIFNSLTDFDTEGVKNNFHLQFLLKLTNFLGFGISSPEEFIKESNNRAFYKDEATRFYLQELISTDYHHKISLQNAQRATMLSDIIFYYQQHIGLQKLKSLPVLNSVLNH